MSIFDQNRIGRSVRCELVHKATGDKITGFVAWTHAMVGETVNSVVMLGNGHLLGPSTVTKVDVPYILDN